MPIKAAPRSVSDATRFTAATPHASSKLAEPRPAPAGRASNNSPKPKLVNTETPEQRVARLRAAHRRATEARVSKADKIIDRGRRFFDSAHKVAVMGLIGFTGN